MTPDEDEETIPFESERRNAFKCEICERELLEYEIAQVVFVNGQYWSVTCSDHVCECVIPSPQKVRMSSP